MRAIPVVCLVLVLPLAACSAGSGGDTATTGNGGGGSGTTRTYPIAGFTGIDLRGSDDVDVRVGTGFSVRAEGPAQTLDRLRLTRVGDTLQIGRVNGNTFGWGGDTGHAVIYVTMPRIMAADIAGSGDVRIDRVDGERFSGRISGSGDLDIAALSAAKANLATRGSGGMTLKGSAGALDIDVAGSGEIDGAGLKATSATVSIAGSGSVRADVAGPARVTVMGSGDVDLGRSAKCTTSKMGSGEVTCGG